MTDQTDTARQLLYRYQLPEDVVDGVLCLHAQELAAVQRRDAAVWGVDTAAGKHILAAADLIDPTKTDGLAPAAAVLAPAPDQPALRERIADAVRDAACNGDCGTTEEECAKERIQPFAWHHGKLAVVEGTPEQIADAVLPVALPATVDRAADEVDADTVASRAAQVITTMGADIRALTSQRDRYRTAWCSARERAQAYGEGILRHVADRDWWKQQAHAVQAHAAAVDRAAVLAEAIAALEQVRDKTDVNVAVHPRYDERQKSALNAGISELRRLAEAQQDEAPRQWCKCRSCWGWFVEEHPGEDLDELGRDLSWWSGLPEHRDAPAGVARQEPTQDGETPRVTRNSDGGFLLHLPEITYLDTQVWSADIGLTDAGLHALRNALATAGSGQPETDEEA